MCDSIARVDKVKLRRIGGSWAAGMLLAAGVSLAAPRGASGAIVYYDTNGATAGTGNATDWNSGNSNWTTDATGSSATTTYPDPSDAVFSAGTNAPATYSINLGGSKTASSLTVNQSAITFQVLGAGSVTRTIGAGGILLQTGAGATNAVGALNFNSPTGAGNESIVLSASQTWTNNASPTTAVSFNPLNTTPGTHGVMTVNGNAAAGIITTVTLAGSADGAYNFAVVVGDGAVGGKLAISTGKNTNFTNVASTFSGALAITGGTTTVDNGGGLGHSNITITGGTLAGGTTGAGGSITDNISNDSAELIALSGAGVIDLTNLHLNLNVAGTQTQAEYVLANAAVGSSNVTGSAFAGVNLPTGWSVDYDGTAAHPGDIVLVAPVPEPASFGMVSIAAAGLLRRRR